MENKDDSLISNHDSSSLQSQSSPSTGSVLTEQEMFSQVREMADEATGLELTKDDGLSNLLTNETVVVHDPETRRTEVGWIAEAKASSGVYLVHAETKGFHWNERKNLRRCKRPDDWPG